MSVDRDPQRAVFREATGELTHAEEHPETVALGGPGRSGPNGGVALQRDGSSGEPAGAGSATPPREERQSAG